GARLGILGDAAGTGRGHLGPCGRNGQNRCAPQARAREAGEADLAPAAQAPQGAQAHALTCFCFHRTVAVIPGRAVGASPESIVPGLGRTEIMDSGLAAPQPSLRRLRKLACDAAPRNDERRNGANRTYFTIAAAFSATSADVVR